MKILITFLLLIANFLLLNLSVSSQKISLIVHDKNKKIITLSDSSKNLIIQVSYSNGCKLNKMMIMGNEVLGKGNIAYSGIRLGDELFSSEHSISTPAVSIKNNLVTVNNIKFGNKEFSVEEEWVFLVNNSDIQWQINRHYLDDGIIAENDFPCWQFNSIHTWDGAMLDNGGVAWNLFLNKPGETYGAHGSALTFWNSDNNSCLKITPEEDAKTFRTTTFTHQNENKFSVSQSSSAKKINTKFGLRRFLKTGQAVFAPDTINKSFISIRNDLKVVMYDHEYDRGILRGIKEKPVNEMLNTIGRYGVVDKDLFGSNGWRTGYAVLQEPWLALLGLAIDSRDFINGYSQTLEFQRDHAIMPDGRVLPRWHYDSSDAMPGTFRPDGFYECQWGYMLDAQPAYAINVAEQFDMTGDINWLLQFKPVCEKVLDYMIKRDSDGNGLVEVIQKSHLEQKGCDWMDVVWASYEVASINAYMYKALVRWSELEELLGDETMSEKYQQLALKIKTTFNKNISDGGFWNPDKNWYVYWREKDGSVYGDNLVGMVNFLAIGYGLCDDVKRKDIILTNIEALMQKEKLFIWPSCFFPYKDGLGLKDVNYPYPNYENGDLFLAWAELGTRCYADKHPEIALKYIKNVINQYELDGLAHQRYTRINQVGAGDDILSNNIMAVVGLYRNIYGIRPLYNRLYLEPHLTADLNGTQLKYWLRNQYYIINLSKENYSIDVNNFSVSNKNPFGINYNGNELNYFNGNNKNVSLKIKSEKPCSIYILGWREDDMSWKQTAKKSMNNIRYDLRELNINKIYELYINNKFIKKYTSGPTGMIHFDCSAGENLIRIQKVHTNR